jgi:uncharacterized protein
MSFGMYQASVPAFVTMLNSLNAILDKAERFAEERKIAPEVLLNWRLAPDMFPLTRQVQIASDMAKGAAARLAGRDVPKYADDETSFGELKARVAKTVKFIESVAPKDFDRRTATSLSLSADRKCASRARPISRISSCRISISTPPRPTPSSGAAGSKSANAISSAGSEGGAA